LDVLKEIQGNCKVFIPEFLEFLKNEQVYYAYFTRYEQFEKWRIDHRYDGILSPEHYINRTFHWKETREGHDFWANLNIKWERKLLKNGK
jgi:hypothetical protein